jgi:anti-sigma factor RsiW
MSSEIHALSGAYAVDALDPDERIEFERHLADCAVCRAEVDSLREAAAGLAGLVETAPPAGLRERVLAETSVVRPLPPLVDRGRRRRPWSALVAAAAAIVVLAGGSVAWHPWSSSSSSTGRLTAVESVQHAPDAQRSTQRLPDGGTVTVYRSVSLDRAAVVVKDLPALPGGKVYEMWLQDPKGSMVLEGRAAAAVGAGMTVEPAGGSSQPTSAPVALLAFDRA